MNQARDGCVGDASGLKLYDKKLPSRHCYLSEHLSCSTTSIGHSFQVGQIVELALFAFHNITLFPGQLLPFCVAEFTDIDVEIEQFLSGEQSIGIVSCNQIIEEQNDRPIEALSIYGVTADVQSFEISSDNCLVGLLIGRQKFYTVNISQNEGQIFATGKVQILHDPQDLSSTGDLAIGNILAQPRNHLVCWPLWLYRLYDKSSLKQQIKNLILPWFDCPNQLFESGNCDAFSIYVASQLPVPVLWRLNLFSMNDVVNRLRTTLKYLNRYNALRCLQCETVITHYSNIFSMSSVGPVAIYVDSDGQHYETVTTSNTENISWSSKKSFRLSWFPGFSWSCGICSNCGHTIGWKYVTFDRKVIPKFFYCLLLSTLEPCHTT